MLLTLAQFTFLVSYIFIVGVILAILEIQIEGRDGWAANLPAWKPKKHSRTAKITYALTRKDMTGYHLSLFALLLFFFHLPFIWNWTWNWQQEIQVLAFFFVFAVIWDFLWFVLNPHYSLRDFGPKAVWWHRTWLFKLPLDYWIGFLCEIILSIPLIWEFGNSAFMQLFILLGLNCLFTAITILIYPHHNGKQSQ